MKIALAHFSTIKILEDYSKSLKCLFDNSELESILSPEDIFYHTETLYKYLELSEKFRGHFLNGLEKYIVRYQYNYVSGAKQTPSFAMTGIKVKVIDAEHLLIIIGVPQTTDPSERLQTFRVLFSYLYDSLGPEVFSLPVTRCYINRAQSYGIV